MFLQGFCRREWMGMDGSESEEEEVIDNVFVEQEKKRLFMWL